MKKLEFDFECPDCGHTFKQRVEEMRPGRSRKCPHCGLTIRFEGDDFRKVQQGLDDLDRNLEKMERELKKL